MRTHNERVYVIYNIIRCGVYIYINIVVTYYYLLLLFGSPRRHGHIFLHTIFFIERFFVIFLVYSYTYTATTKRSPELQCVERLKNTHTSERRLNERTK